MGSLGKILHGGFIKEEPHPHTQLCPPTPPMGTLLEFLQEITNGLPFPSPDRNRQLEIFIGSPDCGLWAQVSRRYGNVLFYTVIV